jgi:hypothetical protein
MRMLAVGLPAAFEAVTAQVVRQLRAEGVPEMTPEVALIEGFPGAKARPKHSAARGSSTRCPTDLAYARLTA